VSFKRLKNAMRRETRNERQEAIKVDRKGDLNLRHLSINVVINYSKLRAGRVAQLIRGIRHG
jgi:hypothetical protein